MKREFGTSRIFTLKRRMARKSRSRLSFTEEEDKIIVEEILKGSRYENVKGSAVWKEIQAHPLLNSHTPRSCQKRFTDTLCKYLHKFEVPEDLRTKIEEVLQIKTKRAPFRKQRRAAGAGQYTLEEDMSILNHIIAREECWNTSRVSYWKTCALYNQKVICIVCQIFFVQLVSFLFFGCKCRLEKPEV